MQQKTQICDRPELSRTRVPSSVVLLRKADLAVFPKPQKDAFFWLKICVNLEIR
jgi:hypothetical protein